MAFSNHRIEIIAAFCAMIWFATIIDACYSWFLPWNVRYIVGGIFILYSTRLLYRNGGLTFTKRRKQLSVCFGCLLFFMMFIKFRIIEEPLKFVPLLCILFWDRNVLLRVYKYIKYFVLFYVIVSLIVEILVLTDLYKSLPYSVFPPQDFIQENNGTINRFYGFFVIPEPSSGISFYRVMGPLREGGHYSIFIGFVYFIERTVYDKRNFILLLGGMLTLSPNFLCFFLISEVYLAISSKRVLKGFVEVCCVVFFTVGAFLISPNNIQERIIHVILERSLEANLENAESDGAMAFFDGRTNDIGLLMYNKFDKKSGFFRKLIGMDLSDIDDGYNLSDFRFLLFINGYIGFALILLCLIKVSFGENGFLFGLCVLLLGLYVMLSRAWMFYHIYIWMLMLIAVNTMSIYKEEVLQEPISE